MRVSDLGSIGVSEGIFQESDVIGDNGVVAIDKKTVSELPCADLESSSEGYAQRFHGPHGRWLLKVQGDITVDILNAVRRKHELSALTVLDVAGGHGQLIEPLQKTPAKLTLAGSAPECFNRLRASNSEHSNASSESPVQSCEFIIAHPENLSMEGKSYDVVTCYRYLSHTNNWREVISELCRVARFAVVVDYPPLLSFNLLYPFMFRVKRYVEGNTRSYSMFRHAEIRNEFERHGFKLRRRVGQFFLPMVLHRKLKNPKLSCMLERCFSWIGLRFLLGSPVIAYFEPMI